MPSTSYFFNDIIIEHRHFSYGLRKKDEITLKMERECIPDFKWFNTSQFWVDIDKDVKILLST